MFDYDDIKDFVVFQHQSNDDSLVATLRHPHLKKRYVTKFTPNAYTVYDMDEVKEQMIDSMLKSINEE